MSSDHPLVSIVVPIYNTGHRLRESAEALLRQTYRPLEIILVNDGSTDNSAAICAEYAKKYPDIVIFLDFPNGGSSVARNRGLEHAKGDWIWFCDSDDLFEPEMCETLLNSALREKAQLSGCALSRDNGTDRKIYMNVVVSGVEVLDRDALLTRWVGPLLRADDSDSKPPVHGMVAIALLSRGLIECRHLRFIPGLAIHQDEAFLLQYLQYVDRAVLTDRPLYHYLSTPNSACDRFFRQKRKYHRTENYRRMLWDNRLAVLRNGDLTKRFPDALPSLLLKAYFHRMCYAFVEPGNGTASRLRKLSGLRKELLHDPDFSLTARQTAPSVMAFRTAVQAGLPILAGFLMLTTLRERVKRS
ncbi:MAG: glycosyltransferase [Victivallaceae bacterium]|nr:glycosyltransferase [Victivallaceae bacterium]